MDESPPKTAGEGQRSPSRNRTALEVDYSTLLEEAKSAVLAAQLRARLAVNNELVGLYWRLGRLILDRQQIEGWGARIVDRLSADLRAEFPEMKGLSRRNLMYMRSFAAAWPEIVQQPVAQLPWGHITVLIDKLEPLTCGNGTPLGLWSTDGAGQSCSTRS